MCIYRPLRGRLLAYLACFAARWGFSDNAEVAACTGGEVCADAVTSVLGGVVYWPCGPHTAPPFREGLKAPCTTMHSAAPAVVSPTAGTMGATVSRWHATCRPAGLQGPGSLSSGLHLGSIRGVPASDDRRRVLMARLPVFRRPLPRPPPCHRQRAGTGVVPRPVEPCCCPSRRSIVACDEPSSRRLPLAVRVSYRAQTYTDKR